MGEGAVFIAGAVVEAGIRRIGAGRLFVSPPFDDVEAAGAAVIVEAAGACGGRVGVAGSGLRAMGGVDVAVGLSGLRIGRSAKVEVWPG